MLERSFERERERERESERLIEKVKRECVRRELVSLYSC